VNELLRNVLFLPEQASTVALEVDQLHYFVIITTMLGATAVGLVTLYFLIRYRERAHRGGDLPPDTRPHHTSGGMSAAVELPVLASLLALFLLWWVIGFRQYSRISDPPPNAIQIYVTAKQWMWSFAYPNGAGSNSVLYVPAGRPVKLVMTSRDVIHSFFVPAFRVKRDVLPGRATMLWFEAKRPGRYPLFCTEFCGAGHSTMLGEVVALSEEDYEHRLEGLEPVQIAADSRVPEQLSLAAMGQRVATTRGCMRCHTSDGTPHIGPTFAALYHRRIPLADQTTVFVDEAYLTSSIMDPAAQIHRGFPPVMPTYQGLLTAPEVGAIVEYIRSLRDETRDPDRVPLPANVDQPVPIVTPLSAGETR
jgi:cytochrome c oxidase subunit 2